eukprot:5532414-Heterocapsa_arctica.AAC.1
MGIVRMLRDCVETTHDIIVEHDSALVPWIVSSASFLYTGFSVGEDGRTPYKRWKSTTYKTSIPPIFEK